MYIETSKQQQGYHVLKRQILTHSIADSINYISDIINATLVLLNE